MSRPTSERDGECFCDYNPATTDGPEETCPFHGRPYAYWVDYADALAARLARVEALADEWEHPAKVYALRVVAGPRLRAALSDPTPAAEEERHG